MAQRTAVLIVAGGSGTRCGGSMPKQFRLLGGRPVLARTIDRFAAVLRGVEIVVVLPERYIDFWKNFAARFDVPAHKVVAGGEERFYSVRNGLEALCSEPELIAVHDAVRPFATPELIRRVAKAAAECGAAIPVVVPADSFREVGPQHGGNASVANGCTDDAAGSDGAAGDSHRIDRSRLRIVQTPQIFRADWLTAAYRTPYDPLFTDDASVVEAAGHPVRLVEGERTNLKITTPDDFLLAEALLTVLEERASEEHDPADEPAVRTTHDRTEEPSVATNRTTAAATENAE